MSKRKTHEDFIKELKEATKTIDTVEEYKGSNEKIEFVCLIHNYKWKSRPYLVLNGISKCPMCNKIKAQETFLNNFNKLEISKNIEIIGEYEKMHEPIKVRCKIDGFEWFSTPHSLLQEHGCLECQKRKLSEIHKMSHDDFVKKSNELNPNLEIIGEYINSDIKIDVRCKKHDIIYSTMPSSVYKGCGCVKCRSEKIVYKKTKTHEKFSEQIYSLYKDDVKILDKYINDITPLHFKHKCGYIFEEKPTVILQNLSCPNCKIISKGEERIKSFLNLYKIEYSYQFKYDDLIGVGGRLLSYDFYFDTYNLLVEYQGEQHEKPIRFNGISKEEAENNFEIQQEHDRRKREYAKERNIELLEIWYWDFDNIEEILSKKLNINSNKKSA